MISAARNALHLRGIAVSGSLWNLLQLTQQPSQLLQSFASDSGILAREADTKMTKKGKKISKQVADQSTALLQALEAINSKFGEGTVMRLGESSSLQIERTSTGCWPLDIALGGGWPKGRTVEIYGPESSGKTTLALHAIAEVQKAGGTAVLIDAEHAFNDVYAARLGLDVKNLLMCQPQTGEQALQVVDELIRLGRIAMIVVDSVAALAPRAEIEGDIGNQLVGAQARMMSAALRKLTGNAAKMGCTILFINQIRNKVGVIYGNPEVTSGGNALKYYASARVDLRRKETLEEDGKAVGIRVRATVKKNKTAAPYRAAEFNILFDRGIDAQGSLVDTAELLGLVHRRGAWYYFGEQKLAQGKGNSAAVLVENSALRVDLEDKIQQALLSPGGLAHAAPEDLEGEQRQGEAEEISVQS